jgi:hypothetical protein
MIETGQDVDVEVPLLLAIVVQKRAVSPAHAVVFVSGVATINGRTSRVAQAVTRGPRNTESLGKSVSGSGKQNSPVIFTQYCPASAALTLVRVMHTLVAPGNGIDPLHHWYCTGQRVDTSTQKVTLLPGQTTWFEGPETIWGGADWM